MRMDPRAPLSASPAERIVPDSRTPLPAVALEATAMLHALGSEAPAPPLALPPSAPAVVALSDDHPLLQAVTAAVIQRIAVVTCPSAEAFVDQLVANGAEIALIDASIAPNPVDIFLLALRRQFPQLQLVVVGPAALQQQLARQIGDGTDFRFAAKPASVERLKSLLLAALHRRERALADAEAAIGHVDPKRRPSFRRAHRRRPVWMLALGLVAAAAALAGWFVSAYASRHLLP